MDDRPNMKEEVSSTIHLERKYIRIGADIPTELRDRLHSSILPGLLSEVIRKLLTEFIDLQKEKGISEPLKAILDNRIKLSIIPKQTSKQEQKLEEDKT